MARSGWCATAFLGVVGFWIGLWMAGERYPSQYDWRYMTISSLLYSDRNPDGYRWAWAGIVLCAMGGLCWTALLVRDWRRRHAQRLPIGIWALAVGYACMLCCALPQQALLPIPKVHEMLALSAFFGICIGIVQLTFQAVERRCRDGMYRFPGGPRVFAGLVAGAALLPIVLAVAAPAYVSLAFPELPWVGFEWRERGVPVYLSFAFWEWITCMVFSAYTASLSLAARSAL